jgi:NADH dehydrogenase
MLGSEICRLLAEQGRPVRALVRPSANPEQVARLRNYGAEVAQGDLRDRESLDVACRQASAVISTSTAIGSRQEGDSIEKIDLQGQVSLVDAAAGAGVRQFVLVSFPPIEASFPLQTAKRTVEERIKQSGMTYTILQPTFFSEIWLSPRLGFDPANGKATIYGAGDRKISWISFQDVAKCAAASVDNPRAANTVIKLGGPEALSPKEVVRLAEQATGKSIVVQHVPEEALRAQHQGATDPHQQSFVGLMLYYANGETIDPKEAMAIFPGYRPRSIRGQLGAAG